MRWPNNHRWDTRSSTVETSPTVTDNQHTALLPRRSSQNIADSEEEEAISNPLKDVLLKAAYASYKMPATCMGVVYSITPAPGTGWTAPALLSRSFLMNFLRNMEYETCY